ncbi:sulfite exporter TauE/SafE family protein [candidate division KSB1 bacterium]|nr:sulfite exporter TauE/SafE family protein [candidate division KSB1 bacterium]
MEENVLKQNILITGFRRRRIRIWFISLMSMILLISLRCFFPEVKLFSLGISSLTPVITLMIFFLALFCEYIDSSLGMGYGTTLTPLLLLFGFAPLQIVPCVLLSELLTGFAATVLHHRDGNVNIFKDKTARTTAILLCLLSVVGAVVAVYFAIHISKVVLTTSISIIILACGILTLSTAGRQFKYRKSHIITLGAVAAFNKSMSGGGYGPLVTAGQVVSGLPPKKAIALTSLAEAFTCLIGLTFYLALGKSIFWPLAIPLTVGALFSVPVSTLTVKHLPENILKKSVGVVTCLLGLFSLAKLFLL